MDIELVLGVAMFVLLFVVAVSIALIAWDQHGLPGKDSDSLASLGTPRGPWLRGLLTYSRAFQTRMNAMIASMSLFASDRERRLWALVIVVAIYSTLGPAGTLVALLRERNMLRVSVALVLLLVVGIIARQWVKRRPSRGEIGVTLGVTATYLMAWVRIQSPEERTHLFEYNLVAVFTHQALIERLRHGRWVPAPAALAR